MNINTLTKIYASKNFQKNEKRRAQQVHSRLSSQNWNFSGRSSGAVTLKSPGTPQDRSVAKSISLNQQFAKSYGHGGFFRNNIKDEQLHIAEDAAEFQKSARKPMSPQPGKESRNSLNGSQHDTQRDSAAQSQANNEIKELLTRMKKSNIPLSTGQLPTRAQSKTTELATILDDFRTATKKTKGKTKQRIQIKNKMRYNAEHVKNKQSHIPFAKFRQPNYIVYNRFGTTSAMQSELTSKQRGAKLKRIFEDRNEQNKHYKQQLLKANYRIGYCQPQSEVSPRPVTQVSQDDKTLGVSHSSKMFSATANLDASPQPVRTSNPLMMSQSQTEFKMTQSQTSTILEQLKQGTHPNQQNRMFKKHIEKVNWNISSKDPKQALLKPFVRKSHEQTQKAEADRLKRNLQELNFRKDMTNQQKANFKLVYPLSAQKPHQVVNKVIAVTEESNRSSRQGHHRQFSEQRRPMSSGFEEMVASKQGPYQAGKSRLMSTIGQSQARQSVFDERDGSKSQPQSPQNREISFNNSSLPLKSKASIKQGHKRQNLFGSIPLVKSLKRLDQLKPQPPAFGIFTSQSQVVLTGPTEQSVRSKSRQEYLQKLQPAQSSYAITTKHGLINSSQSSANARTAEKKVLNEHYDINKNQNLHYRGVRQPGLITYAGGAGLSHVLPPNQSAL